MNNYYNIVMGSLSGLSVKELDDIIAQATAQKSKMKKDVLIKASQKVLDALKEYDSIIIGSHPMYDDGEITIEASNFYISNEGYLAIN